MDLAKLEITVSWLDLSTERNFENDSNYAFQASETIAFVEAAAEPAADLDGPRLRPWTSQYVQQADGLKWWVRVVSGKTPATLYPYKAT